MIELAALVVQILQWPLLIIAALTLLTELRHRRMSLSGRPALPVDGKPTDGKYRFEFEVHNFQSDAALPPFELRLSADDAEIEALAGPNSRDLSARRAPEGTVIICRGLAELRTIGFVVSTCHSTLAVKAGAHGQSDWTHQWPPQMTIKTGPVEASRRPAIAPSWFTFVALVVIAGFLYSVTCLWSERKQPFLGPNIAQTLQASLPLKALGRPWSSFTVGDLLAIGIGIVLGALGFRGIRRTRWPAALGYVTRAKLLLESSSPAGDSGTAGRADARAAE